MHIRRSGPFIVLFLIALVVRLAYFQTLPDHPEFRTPMLDAGWFHEQATAIVDGDWSAPEAVFRAPLYPYLLAGIYTVAGPDPAAARLIQLIAGSLTVLLIARLGGLLFGRSAALVSGVIAALYWTSIYFEGELLIASVLPLLASLLLLALIRAERDGGSRAALIAGLSIGFFAVARPNVLLFLPAAMLWLWHRNRRGAVLLLAGVLMLVLPVTVRNRVVSGEWVFLSSQGGLNFYIGNQREADGMHAVYPGLASWRNDDIDRLTAARIGHEPTPNESSRYWFREGLREIAADPPAWIGAMARKAYFLAGDFEIGNNRDLSLYRRENRVLSLPLVTFGVLLPLALVGLLIAPARRRLKPLFVLYILFYALSVVLFFVCGRFRLPLVPALVPLAGGGLVATVRAVREMDRRRLIGVAALVVVVNGAVSIDPFRVRSAAEGQEAFHRGNVLARQGKSAAAALAYREAIGRIPRFAGAHYHLGVVLLGEGREEEGVGELRTAMDLDRSNPRIPVSLAGHLAETGRTAEAESLYRQTIELDRYFPDGYVDLGALLAESGRLTEAEPFLRRGVELDPDDPAALLNLGKLLAATDRDAEAEPFLVRLTDRSPDERGGWFELGNLHYRTGRFETAATAFRRAAAIAPGDVPSRLNLSAALHRSGDLPGAVIALREVLAIDPANETARVRLEQLGLAR